MEVLEDLAKGSGNPCCEDDCTDGWFWNYVILDGSTTLPIFRSRSISFTVLEISYISTITRIEKADNVVR